jgi:hypothetical protein
MNARKSRDHTKRRSIMLALPLCAIAGVASAADFDLSWHTFDASAAAFELRGTIGQPDAGVMSGGAFELRGGFWAGVGRPGSCFGDLDGDGQVTLTDLSLLLSNFGVPSGAMEGDGDLDDDGDVDLTDLSLLLSAFGTMCP